MRKKRQQFRQQIRRSAIESIFRKKRQFFFNYKYSNQSQIDQNQQKHRAIDYEQVKAECFKQFQQYSEQMFESLDQQNMARVFELIISLEYYLKSLLKKVRKNRQCIQFVIKIWFQHGIDQLLMDTIKKMQSIEGRNLSAEGKHIYRMALSQFYLVSQYNVNCQLKLKSKAIFNFLFCAIQHLSNLPQEIKKIFSILNFMVKEEKRLAHELFFWNTKLSSYQKQDMNRLISFENLTFIMFQNKDKFFSYNSSNQQNLFNQIKSYFISIFVDFAMELHNMSKYVQNARRQCNGSLNQNITSNQHNSLSQGNKAHQEWKKQQSVDKDNKEIYEKTLQLYEYPQEITLKQFLSKPVLASVMQIIAQSKSYYFRNWQEGQQYQNSLAQCLEAFRLLIQFNPSPKILKSREFEDQLASYVDLLGVRKFSMMAKKQILHLLDLAIYFDSKNESTQCLLASNNLFDLVWGVQTPEDQYIKINIINNLMLSISGHRQVTRHLSEIVIMLYQNTHRIQQTLDFVNNYFSFTYYQMKSRTNDELVIQLLQSLPQDNFKTEQIQFQILLFSKLYAKGYCRKPPQRYYKWKLFNIVHMSKSQAIGQKYQFGNKMIEIYQSYNKEEQQLNFMNQE